MNLFRCRHVSGKAHLVRLQIANGHIQLRRQCDDCGQVYGPAIRQKGAPVESYPLVETEYLNPPCEMCGDHFTALHHWLPRAIAGREGQDAEAWPTSYLCRRCHALWHKLVTPGLLDEGWNG